VKYFAPGVISSPQTVTVTATSVWDNSKTAPAQVTLVPSVAVSVSPANATVYAFQTLQFAATVNYSSNQTVSWSLNPKVGTISPTGLYTAPGSVIAQQTVSVIATGPDIGAGTNAGTATFTLVPRISASITAPTGLITTVVSNSEIDLSWTGSTEPGGSIAGYNIYHNGIWVGAATGTSYADRGLISSTSYTYTVAAYDTSGIASAQSAGASASTLSGNSPNLVAYYNFNEGAGAVLHDSSGHGNNGAITSAAWSGSGKYGGSLVFDGASSYVAVPGSDSLSFSAGMTLEAWVNPSALSGGEVFLQYGWFSLWTQWNGVTGSVTINTWGNGAVWAAPALSYNTWTHLAMAYDGATLGLFVNGVQVNSQALSGPINNGTDPIYIGGDALQLGGPPRNLDGMIGEVRIYNRGLSQAEILNDMAGAAAPTLTSVSPASGVQGTSVPVTLTGTNFVAGATVAVSNPGIAVGSATVVSATQITATLTIAANAAPGAANVTVTTSGGTSGSIVFTVNPLNHTPTPQNQTQSVPYRQASTFALLGGDPDAGDSLSFATTAGPGKGIVTYSNSARTATYTSNAGASGSDTFTYRSTDQGGLSATATVTTNIQPVDVTVQTAITASGLAFSRSRQLYTGTITVKNTTAQTIPGPVQLVLHIMAAGITLANATGTTTGGDPYLNVVGNDGLAAGQSVTLPTQLSDPGNVPIKFTPQVYSGIL
jgi:hypothetical protein